MEGFETFTPGERAYMDSKGEKPVADEAPPAEDEAVVEAENEAVEDDSDAPETEAKEENASDDEGAKEEKKKKDVGRVPLRKLREEEDRRKQVETERDTLKEQFARADERLKLLFNAQQQQAKEPAPPDKNQDPIGFMEWQQSQIERLEQGQRAQQEHHQRQSQIGQIDNAYKQSWSAFASKTPDALDAYQHFVNVTAGFLEMQGVSAEQINQLVENEERKITVAAMQRRVSPAELIYEKAKAFGFQPKPVVTQQQKNDEAAQKAEADVERRQKGAAAAKSLSTAGGSRGGQSITAAELASMSDDEFDEVRSKLGDKAMRKLMGD